MTTLSFGKVSLMSKANTWSVNEDHITPTRSCRCQKRHFLKDKVVFSRQFSLYRNNQIKNLNE